MDVFALTSRLEGLPLAILEAWAAGLPVIASSVGGVPALVDPGRTGLLFPSGDEETLAGLLGELLANPAQARALGCRPPGSADAVRSPPDGRGLRPALPATLRRPRVAAGERVLTPNQLLSRREIMSLLQSASAGNRRLDPVLGGLERSHISRKADPLRGRDMLCFSHDWSGDPLSKTHLMRLLARDNRILWVNSIGYRAPSVSRRDLGRAFRKLTAAMQPMTEPIPNLHVLNPLVIPAYGIPAIRALNTWLLRLQVKRAMRCLRFRRPINWVFNPAASLVAGSLGEETVVYYCVDEYTAFSGVPTRALADMEDRLLRRADQVFVSAERLYQSKARVNPRMALVRHGVDFDHFRQALAPETEIPEEIARLPRPVLGYFGLIAADWVDVDLLVHLAKRFPQASLVLIGKATMDVSALERLPNVHLLGQALRDAARLLQGVRRRPGPLPGQRGDLECQPAQGARVPCRRPAGGIDPHPGGRGAGHVPYRGYAGGVCPAGRGCPGRPRPLRMRGARRCATRAGAGAAGRDPGTHDHPAVAAFARTRAAAPRVLANAATGLR